MNTIDVERRLEALAAGSASPDLPLPILDRLSDLEAGVDAQPVRISTVRGIHRGSSRNGRRFLLLGVAATLAIAGSLVYAAGNLNKPAPLPTPPVTLGQWHQIHAFTASDYDQFEHVSLSWQNGEIVGVATGNDKDGLGATCVLRSKDGTNWSCSELPKPADLCTVNACVQIVSVAVSKGAWVATGIANTTGGKAISLTWTSPDGVTWTERPSLRVTIGDSIGNVAVIGFSSFPTNLLATRYGFVRSGSVVAPLQAPSVDGLMTSSDGANWQPANLTPGSPQMLYAYLAASPYGYLAMGMCATTAGSGSRACAAYSTDGENWTTSYPGTGATVAASDTLSAYGLPVFRGGRWVTDLLRVTPSDGTRAGYEADSTDGINWTIRSLPGLTELQTAFSSDQSQTYYPAYSLPDTDGTWGIGGAGVFAYTSSSASDAALPPTPAIDDPYTYWSETGSDWVKVSSGPVGNPLAIVDTPTQLIALIAVYPDGTGPGNPPGTYPSVSVWAATKH